MTLTPEERARVAEIQDQLIERFVEQSEAIQDGREVRAKELDVEIDELIEEKAQIEMWATVGSA